MEPIDLEPRFSTKEIPGKCIKCLAEQRLNSCLRQLLMEETENKELEETYEALVSFLESPELRRMRDEAEKCLAEERDVKVVLHLGGEKPRYEIKPG